MNQHTIGDVLYQLAEQGYIDAEQELNFGTDEQEESAWFIQGLLGCGGWLAAIFFSICGSWFLFLVIGSTNSDTGFGISMAVVGAIMVIATTLFRRNSASAFTIHLALALQIAAQVLIAFGLGIALLDNGDDLQSVALSIIALVMLVLELVLIAFYRDQIFRFLATVAAVGAVNVIIYDLEIPVGLTIVASLLGIALAVIWSEMLPLKDRIQYRPILQPIGYGLVFGLAGTIAFELTLHFENFLEIEAAIYQPLIVGIVFLLTLLQVEQRLINEYDLEQSNRTMLILGGLTVIIALPVLTTPGIIAGLMLIVLGYRRRNPILLGLAYAFLIGFVSYFYYALHYTLLTKSFILMATGLLFLLARYGYQQLLPTNGKSMEVTS